MGLGRELAHRDRCTSPLTRQPRRPSGSTRSRRCGAGRGTSHRAVCGDNAIQGALGTRSRSAAHELRGTRFVDQRRVSPAGRRASPGAQPTAGTLGRARRACAGLRWPSTVAGDPRASRVRHSDAGLGLFRDRARHDGGPVRSRSGEGPRLAADDGRVRQLLARRTRRGRAGCRPTSTAGVCVDASGSVAGPRAETVVRSECGCARRRTSRSIDRREHPAPPAGRSPRVRHASVDVRPGHELRRPAFAHFSVITLRPQRGTAARPVSAVCSTPGSGTRRRLGT